MRKEFEQYGVKIFMAYVHCPGCKVKMLMHKSVSDPKVPYEEKQVFAYYCKKCGNMFHIGCTNSAMAACKKGDWVKQE